MVDVNCERKNGQTDGRPDGWPLSSLYHNTENYQTSGQSVQIQMTWLIISHLIWIYAVCKFNSFFFGALSSSHCGRDNHGTRVCAVKCCNKSIYWLGYFNNNSTNPRCNMQKQAVNAFLNSRSPNQPAHLHSTTRFLLPVHTMNKYV